MKHFRVLLLSLLLLSVRLSVKAEAPAFILSPTAEISLLTVAPGAELYSCFGHSGIRICDTAQQLDIVFNYGTFDFDRPGFYLNFVKGKLWYQISAEPFQYFKAAYTYENRRVTELKLNLTAIERKQIFDFLVNNYKPENRDYRYDFFLDNCSSRLRDVMEKNLQGTPQWDYTAFTPGLSFRDLIRPYIIDRKWTNLGISLILGLPTDRKASFREYVFLPDHLETSFKKARKSDGSPLVTEEKVLVDLPRLVHGDFPGTPMYLTLGILLFTLGWTFLEFRKKQSGKGMDYFLWTLSGLLGVFYLFMWWGTDHYFCSANLNLLWANPFNLLAIFLLMQGPVRVRLLYAYLVGYLLLLSMVMLGWNFLPQPFSPVVFPLILALWLRAAWRGYLHHQAQK